MSTALGLGGATRIFRRDATKLGAAHPVEPFSLVFLDPPYGQGLAEQALVSARAGGWLAPDALVVVEEAAEAAFAPPEGFRRDRAAALRRHRIHLICASRSSNFNPRSAPARLDQRPPISRFPPARAWRDIRGVRRSGGGTLRPRPTSRSRTAGIVEHLARSPLELAARSAPACLRGRRRRSSRRRRRPQALLVGGRQVRQHRRARGRQQRDRPSPCSLSTAAARSRSCRRCSRCGRR